MPDSPPLPERPAWQLRLVIAALAALVFLPILFYGCEGELDRWRAAAWMERYLDGERDQAIDGLAEIVARQPDDQQLRATLAQWLLDAGQTARALTLVSEVPDAERDARLLGVLQDGLLAAGRTDEALRVFRRRFPANEVRDPTQTEGYLNELSYLQALDGSDLHLARKNSTNVVAFIANDWNRAFGMDLTPRQQAALAAVVVYRGSAGVPVAGQEIRTKKYRERILEILDGEIARITRVSNWLLPGIGLRGIASGAERPEEVDSSRSALATMLTARALVWQDLGELDRSFADRRQVVRMGHDPAIVAEKWPALAYWVTHLRRLAAVLDTRGCVMYKSGEAELALKDLDAAVLGQEALVRADAWRLPGVWIETTDLRERRQEFEVQPRKTLAVLLYHRSWALWAVGRAADAQADLRRVRKLGYVPGPHLF